MGKAEVDGVAEFFGYGAICLDGAGDVSAFYA